MSEQGLWVFLPKTFYWDQGASFYDTDMALDSLEDEYCRLGWAMFWAQVAIWGYLECYDRVARDLHCTLPIYRIVL